MMVLGLAYGGTSGDDSAAKEATYAVLPRGCPGLVRSVSLLLGVVLAGRE